MHSRLFLSRSKDLLWAIAFAGLLAAILRFAFGLGATTGLNDASPWGIWIAFKLGFVALSGGGFTLAAMVYIFHLESYRPILTRAILLALLGYGSFIVSLIFDLGLPWHIYMPVISWQHHSVMFEIAWCVMLYFTVLVLEFGPSILEHPWFRHPLFQKIYSILHKFTLPVVIAGIVLSTLHQSSLGGLFLILPHRVHPLWYSPWIPVMFFISAIAAGLMALIVEGFLAVRLFGRELQLDLLKRLGKIGGFVLLLYLGLRLGDLALRGSLPYAWDGSWQSLLFWAEILVGGVLPAAWLLWRKEGPGRQGLLASALLAIFGVLSQRMSLSMFTLWRPESAPYSPSGLEILIAFAIPAAAALIYTLFSEHLPVFEQEVARPVADPYARPQFDPDSLVLQEDTLFRQLSRRAGVAVLALSLVAAFLPAQVVGGEAMPPSPVRAAVGWEVIKIDGDRDGVLVAFPHLEHQDRLVEQLGDDRACETCHHLSKPEDKGTACSECHRDNYAATSMFDHVLHTRSLGGNAACDGCHTGEHRASTAVACVECHETMSAGPGELQFNYLSPAYQSAMHDNCLGCHREEAAAQDGPELAGCSNCHKGQQEVPAILAASRP